MINAEVALKVKNVLKLQEEESVEVQEDQLMNVEIQIRMKTHAKEDAAKIKNALLEKVSMAV